MQNINIKLDFETRGFNMFNENIFKLDKDQINKSFDLHFKNPKFRDNNYKNVAILNFKDVKETLYLNILNEIIKIFKDNNLNYDFDCLWLQNSNHSFSQSNVNERPFIPHIDKRRCLKVMIYLNDIKKNAGPINLAKTNPSNFENIRRNLEVDYQIKKKNVIKSIPLEKYISCEGNFGTSIFFDTNTPHFAGQINDKKVYRKILRFTFLKPMNKTSKIRYYFKKIFN
mgnify:CR=1 FL=1